MLCLYDLIINVLCNHFRSRHKVLTDEEALEELYALPSDADDSDEDVDFGAADELAVLGRPGIGGPNTSRGSLESFEDDDSFVQDMSDTSTVGIGLPEFVPVRIATPLSDKLSSSSTESVVNISVRATDFTATLNLPPSNNFLADDEWTDSCQQFDALDTNFLREPKVKLYQVISFVTDVWCYVIIPETNYCCIFVILYCYITILLL